MEYNTNLYTLNILEQYKDKINDIILVIFHFDLNKKLKL